MAVWIDVEGNARGCMRIGSYEMHIGYLSVCGRLDPSLQLWNYANGLQRMLPSDESRKPVDCTIYI